MFPQHCRLHSVAVPRPEVPRRARRRQQRLREEGRSAASCAAARGRRRKSRSPRQKEAFCTTAAPGAHPLGLLPLLLLRRRRPPPQRTGRGRTAALLPRSARSCRGGSSGGDCSAGDLGQSAGRRRGGRTLGRRRPPERAQQGPEDVRGQVQGQSADVQRGSVEVRWVGAPRACASRGGKRESAHTHIISPSSQHSTAGAGRRAAHRRRAAARRGDGAGAGAGALRVRSPSGKRAPHDAAWCCGCGGCGWYSSCGWCCG